MQFIFRVPHLGSEINFIEDMVEDSMLVGESGHMVTTLSVRKDNDLSFQYCNS